MIYQEASKERFILNNPKLSDEEKSEMLNFYKDHSNLDSIGIDWQKDWDYSDFKKVKDKYIKPIDDTGLEPGKDFLYFGEKDGLSYYVPLSYKAIKKLVGKERCSRWCVTDSELHWDEYTCDRNSYFALVFDKSNDPICIEFGETDLNFWNKQNYTYGFDYSLNNNKQLDFLNPTNKISPFANSNRALAFHDNKRYAQYLSFDIINTISSESDKIINLIKENAGLI